MARLLLADDQPQELEHLARILSSEGHTCAQARDGAEAVKRFTIDRPDLVILDVLMPGMDGIKATRKLKQQAAGAYVPVLLVTGLDDVEDRLAGFDAGADDFLTKPVEDWELRARVRTFLQIAAQQRATEEALRKVQSLQSMRDELTELLVHDLKSPLASLSANLSFVESRLDGDAAGREALADCRDSTARLLRMIAMLLDISRLEERRFAPALRTEVGRKLLEDSRKARVHEADFLGVRIEVAGDPSLTLQVDPDLMGRVIDNLLDNALRFTPRGGTIRLACERVGDGARLVVANTGAIIPERDRLRIFGKYERLSRSPGRASRGLGLYFCHLAVEAHLGRITVGDDEGRGTAFRIDLPGQPGPPGQPGLPGSGPA